jgi:hypothetical protein
MSQTIPGRGDRLSIVVGARLGELPPDACLEALAGQVDADVEVIVVDDGGPDRYPAWVTRVERRGGLVPELWAEGIRLATGSVVALTTSTIVAGSDFVERTRELHRQHEPVIGGPIEPAPDLRVLDWAVYFCRYMPYMSPLTDEDRLEIPGDNASYRADVLAQYRNLYDDGFWEPFVHRAMRSDGHVLRIRPDRVVHHARGMSASAFCRQRFLHGRANGEHRSIGMTRRSVLLASLSAPVVPFVMTARTARLVVQKRRHVLQFAVALPIVFWFYCWWAAGEFLGRLRAARIRTGR